MLFSLSGKFELYIYFMDLSYVLHSKKNVYAPGGNLMSYT